MAELKKKPLFNPEGDIDVRLRRMIGGNTTNLNDFNNMKYPWVSDWYRQAMNNFWIPEEINLSQDVKDYPRLLPAERTAYDKILSFLVFLDSIQTANLPVEDRRAPSAAQHLHWELLQRVPGAKGRPYAAARDDGQLHFGGHLFLQWLHVLLQPFPQWQDARLGTGDPLH